MGKVDNQGAAGPAQSPEPAAAASSEPAGTLAITNFNFQHRVFQAAGARFLLKGAARVPTFRVEMGDLEGLLEIDVLKREFNLTPETHDGMLIDLAVAGLRYVPDIKPGDTIPSEILTGQASWTVSPKHKRVAEQRLQVQLLSWVSGKEVLLTDPKEIALFLDQIENREKLRNAFKDAAKALGQDPENTEAVLTQLELLSRELCYIEALRDRFILIPKIGEKMNELAKSYGSDRNAKLEINRVMALLKIGIDEYTAIFEDVDAQTGEIIAALKSIERQIGYIRRVRDDLHFLIMQWDPYIAELGSWHGRRTPETDKALSNLYRFLAPRYSSGKSILKRRKEGEGLKSHKNSPGAAKPGVAGSVSKPPPKPARGA